MSRIVPPARVAPSPRPTPPAAHPQPAVPVEPVLSPTPVPSSGKGQMSSPPQGVSKVRKGVKRKADTTTPSTTPASAVPLHNSFPMLDSPKASKITTRRESGRQIKPPKRELPDEEAQHQKGKKSKLSVQLRHCHGILKEMLSKKHAMYAWPFFKPVDADVLGLHDYHDIIKHPMDLGTIKDKLENRVYKNANEFAADMRMMFTNCYKYNPPDHDVVNMARKLQDVFEVRFAKMPDEPMTAEDDDDDDDTKDSDPSSHPTSASGSDTDDSEVEREEQLTKLQAQLKSVHEQLTALSQASQNRSKKKKDHKKKRRKDKDPENHTSSEKEKEMMEVDEKVEKPKVKDEPEPKSRRR